MAAMQELCTGGLSRAVKRCDGDSDASVRSVGEGATRYHAGGDGELRFVKMVHGRTPPGSVQGLAMERRSLLDGCNRSLSEKPALV